MASLSEALAFPTESGVHQGIGEPGAQLARAEALTACPPPASLTVSQLGKGEMRFHSISGAPGAGPTVCRGP